MRTRDWLARNGGCLAVILLMVLSVMVIAWGMYTQTHRTVDLGDGLLVHVSGRCVYAAHIETTGARRQFWGWNDSTFGSGTTMEPYFVIENKSPRPRTVNIRSLSAWSGGHERPEIVPASGRMTRSFKFKHDWWVWVDID